MEDFVKAEKNPSFDPTGMLIAEWDGNPVGFVNAFIDKERKEKKGFIRVLGVHPEYRRRGCARARQREEDLSPYVLWPHTQEDDNSTLLLLFSFYSNYFPKKSIM